MNLKRALAAALGLALCLSGCGASGAAQSSAAPVFSAPGGLPAAQPEKLRVLLALPGLEDSAMLGIARGMQDACDWAGVEITIDDAGGDAALQGESIAVFAGSGGQAVACWPVDADALTPYAQDASARGLAVIGLNAALPGAESRLLLDGAGAGRLLAEAAAAQWEMPATARGTVLVLEKSGHWLHGFSAGAREALAAIAPEIAVESVSVDADAGGYAAFDKAAGAYGDLVAVLAATDGLALSVYNGLLPAGQGGADAPAGGEAAAPGHSVPDWFFIGGVGATEEALAAIRAGGLFRASVNLAPYEAGQQLAELALQAVAGSAPAELRAAPVLVDGTTI